MLVERFPVAIGVVAGLVIAVTGVFVLSMPMSSSPIDEAMLESSHGRDYAIADVRRAFAEHGVPLRSPIHAVSGVTLVGSTPQLFVFVADPGSGGDSGVRAGSGYEQRVGNLLVHYGGADKRTLAHVRAAVAALR